MFHWLESFVATHTELRLDLLGGLLLATVLGGAIGWEREHSHKPAGLRTNILICMAATLLTDISLRASALFPTADPGRIAAQIVTGVGFLGAGTIIQTRGTVTGLTTAATLWMVAAIGMAIGFGALIEAVGTTLLVMVTLIPLRSLEDRIEAHWKRSDRPPPPDARD
jgi:putative Mg2+ transporter-C (MgtC) family protein